MLIIFIIVNKQLNRVDNKVKNLAENYFLLGFCIEPTLLIVLLRLIHVVAFFERVF